MSHWDVVQRLSRGCAWASSNDAERRKYVARALDMGISPCVAAAACPHPGTAAAAAMRKHTQAVVTQTSAQRQPSAGGTGPVQQPAPASGRAEQTPRQQQQLSRWQRMRHGSWRRRLRRCRSCGRTGSSWSASQRSATRCVPVDCFDDACRYQQSVWVDTRPCLCLLPWLKVACCTSQRCCTSGQHRGQRRGQRRGSGRSRLMT